MGKISRYAQRPALHSLIGAIFVWLGLAGAGLAQPVESFGAFKDRMEAVAVANGIDRDFYRAVMGPVTTLRSRL